MKRILTLTFSCLILLSANAFAQKKADTTKKKTKKTTTVKVDKKADTKTTVVDTKAKTETPAITAKTKTTKTVTEGVNKSADKAIGKDAKGNTIYLGPKGGQYTLSASGKKNYIKTSDKIKVN